MCFTLKIANRAIDEWDRSKIKKPIPQIATKDIKVWKILTTCDYGPYRSLIINKVKEKWTPGTHYTETTPFRSTNIQASWEDGLPSWKLEVNGDAFHSYIVKSTASKRCGYTKKLVKMYIPKGATYYKNSVHYVSSDIVYPHQTK